MAIPSGFRLIIAVLALLSASGLAAAETFEVTAGRSQISFDLATGNPVAWQLCESDCADPGARRADLFTSQSGRLEIRDAFSAAVPVTFITEDEADAVVIRIVAGNQQRLFRLFRDSARAEIELAAGSRMQIASGTNFIPEPLPGIGAIYSRVRFVQVREGGQQSFDFDSEQQGMPLLFDTQSWSGIRNRYWAWLIRPLNAQSQSSLALVYTAEDQPVVDITADASDARIGFEIYAGPVEWRQLRQVSLVLPEMLFAALWDFLRWLCFGMLLLLDWIYSVAGNYGVAIILLSLTAKILMTPLTRLADRWQAEVNQINGILQPEIAAIRQQYKGEDAHNRTLAIFEKHGVSQWYTFKSAAGFLIQIPIFIAAFDMLAENFALSEIAFLWISDLAKPDQFAKLPFTLPFFGSWLNLLPFLMSGLSLLAAWLQNEASLTPELQRQQSVRLYLMALAFFILFYTFPAGMVLYWTSSNLFHLLKVEAIPAARRFFGRQRL